MHRHTTVLVGSQTVEELLSAVANVKKIADLHDSVPRTECMDMDGGLEGGRNSIGRSDRQSKGSSENGPVVSIG